MHFPALNPSNALGHYFRQCRLIQAKQTNKPFLRVGLDLLSLLDHLALPENNNKQIVLFEGGRAGMPFLKQLFPIESRFQYAIGTYIRHSGESRRCFF